MREPGGPLDGLKTVDPKARLGLTGSTSTGKVGNPNKPTFGQPWNPDSFDLDLFIESERIFDFLKKQGKVIDIIDGREVIRGVDRVIPLGKLRDLLVRQNPELFKGLKEGGAGVSLKVYKQAPSGGSFGPPIIYGK
jgi:hypothetical protein